MLARTLEAEGLKLRLEARKESLCWMASRVAGSASRAYVWIMLDISFLPICLQASSVYAFFIVFFFSKSLYAVDGPSCDWVRFEPFDRLGKFVNEMSSFKTSWSI